MGAKPNQIRITGGELRGRMIRTGAETTGFRPTQGRVREAIFSSLESQNKLVGAVALDLFAGAGTLGIEALSRGADFCTFVEDSHKLTQSLLVNLNELALSGRCKVVEGDVWRINEAQMRANEGSLVSLLFIDPPYKTRDIETILVKIRASGLLGPGAMIVWEHEKSFLPDDQRLLEGSSFSFISKKVYGDTAISYYTAA